MYSCAGTVQRCRYCIAVPVLYSGAGTVVYSGAGNALLRDCTNIECIVSEWQI